MIVFRGDRPLDLGLGDSVSGVVEVFTEKSLRLPLAPALAAKAGPAAPVQKVLCRTPCLKRVATLQEPGRHRVSVSSPAL